MKSLILFLCLSALCPPVFAHSGRIIGNGPRYGYQLMPPTPRRPVSTQLSQPAVWEHRIVDGVCYNIERSVKWGRLIPKGSLSVRKILPDGVIFQIHERDTALVTTAAGTEELNSTASWTPNSFQSGVTNKRSATVTTQSVLVPAGLCFVRNFPDGHLLTVGERVTIASLFVMRVPPIQFEGQPVPTYDRGLDNTLENRKTLKAR